MLSQQYRLCWNVRLVTNLFYVSISFRLIPLNYQWRIVHSPDVPDLWPWCRVWQFLHNALCLAGSSPRHVAFFKLHFEFHCYLVRKSKWHIFQVIIETQNCFFHIETIYFKIDVMICVNNHRELLTITNYNVHHFRCKKQRATTDDTTLQNTMIILSYHSTHMPYSPSTNQQRLSYVAR